MSKRSTTVNESQDGRYTGSGDRRQRSRSQVSRPPTISEGVKSPLEALGNLRSSTPHLALPGSAENPGMQEIAGDLGTATRKYGDLLPTIRHKLAIAEGKAKTAEMEAAAWKREYETIVASRDGLQRQLDAANRKNWELLYEVQDAKEEAQILLGYLENSIRARFQGAPGGSHDGWKNPRDGSWLPLYAYEAKRASLLRTTPSLRPHDWDKESELDATREDARKEKVPPTSRRSAAKTTAVDEMDKPPTQSAREARKGERASREASGKDWEKRKPHR